MNTIAALTNSGIKAPFIFEGTLNGNLFEYYAEEFLSKILNQNTVLVLDNAATHKHKKALEILKKTGTKILFLPPYSPDLNPIEKYWATLKSFLKSKIIDTVDELFLQIANFVNHDFNTSFDHYIKSCGY